MLGHWGRTPDQVRSVEKQAAPAAESTGKSEEVLDAVEQHTLTWPIRHGARVQLPHEETDQPSLYEDI